LDEELKALRLFDRLFALLQVERRMEKRALRETVADLSQQLQSLRPHDGWTFNTWSAWLNAWTLIHQMKGEFQKMFESCTELLELWEENVALQKAEPIRHLRVQTQWLNSALASGNIGSHLEKVRALRKGPPATNQEQARLVFQSLNLELLWLIQQENLNTALKFIESFQSAMKPLLPLLTEVHLRAFQINSAEVLFRSGQYAKVLKLLNPVFKGSNQGRDSTTFRFALLLGIVCHLEVGNHTLAESQLALLTRRLRNEDADWEFGHLAAKWLRKLHKDWGTSETKRIKAAFAVALGDLSHDKSTITRLRDLLALWCEG
jgi:tetratricopeptide (TPR) repeat protein